MQLDQLAILKKRSQKNSDPNHGNKYMDKILIKCINQSWFHEILRLKE